VLARHRVPQPVVAVLLHRQHVGGIALGYSLVILSGVKFL
jgi:hypothetical protein